MRALNGQWMSAKMMVWHHWQLKKSKSWGPFLGHQLNSTANSAHIPRKWNGLNWQCCLASSSKTATKILIFSIASGDKPSFLLKFIVHWVPAFFIHNNLGLARVWSRSTKCFVVQFFVTYIVLMFLPFFEIVRCAKDLSVRVAVAEAIYGLHKVYWV